MRINFGIKVKGEKGIRRLSTRKFLLDVNVREQGRKREIFEGTLHEARVRLSELKKGIKENSSESGSLKSLLVKNIIEYYCENHFKYTVRAKFAQSYIDGFNAEFGEIPVEEFTVENFESWLRRRANENTRYKTKPKPETINFIICTVKSAFNLCLRRGIINKNPIASVKKLPPMNIQRRVLSLLEFKQLYSEVTDYLKPWLEFIYKVPTRRGEVLSLRYPEDISLSEGVLYLRDEKSKTKKGRILVIPESMKPYFASIPAESKWVFYRPELMPDGKTKYCQLDGRCVLQSVTRAAERLNLGKITVHMFRRTAAINMLRNGVDIKTVQAAGGWSSLAILAERYLPLVDDDLKKAVAKIDVPIQDFKLSA